MKACTPYEGDYCCEHMTSVQFEGRVPIDYDPKTITYFIPLSWPDSQRECIRFCPWCGKDITSEWLKRKSKRAEKAARKARGLE